MNKHKIVHIVFILFCSLVYGQQNRYTITRKGTFYTANFAGINSCRVGGLDGNERRHYINDYVSALRDKGYTASGGMYPRTGIVIGGQGGYYFSHRFAWGGEFSYTQKGYQEDLRFSYADTSYRSTIKVRADYVDCALGVMYHSDYKIKIFLGGGMGLVVNDRVVNKYKVTGSDTLIEKNEKTYINQYFNINRRLYLPFYVWGITYQVKKYWGISFRVQKTGNMFTNKSKHQDFLMFQLAVVRRYL